MGHEQRLRHHSERLQWVGCSPFVNNSKKKKERKGKEFHWIIYKWRTAHSLLPSQMASSLSTSPPAVARGDGAKGLEDSSIQDLQAPPGPAISFHRPRRREWNQKQAESKGCAELKSLVLSFFFFKHKTVWSRTPLLKDQPDIKTFQSLLPKNVLPHATRSSVLTVVMRTNIL